MSIENRSRAALAGVLLFGASFGASGCGKELKLVDSAPATSTPISTPVGSERLTVATPDRVVVVEVKKEEPNATQVPAGQRESIVDHEMKAGETYKAKDGSMVKGDVLVDGVRYFDDNERTGLVIELHKNANITAPWGANVSEVGVDQITRNAVFGQAVEEMKAKGCVNGCDRVDVVKIPGGKPQGK